MYAQPMRELRLEMQIVFLPIPVPFSGGKKLNLPVLTIIKPVSSRDEDPEIDAKPADD